MERQAENFKNHVATFTDYGNIKILDFKNPNSNNYRIRFLFEEDYCRLHISGDLGELIATNYNNMTFKGFSDFVNDVGYFEEKIDCHNRKIYWYDVEAAKEELVKRIKEYDLLEYVDRYSWESDEEKLEAVLADILSDFSDSTGIGNKGYDVLDELDSDAWEWAYDLGKKETGILDLYMLAFKLAMKQIEGNNQVAEAKEDDDSTANSQGDLISRSALLEELDKREYSREKHDFKIMIERQPTAYDVDMVAKRLAEMRKCEDAGWCNHCQNTWCPLELLDADETISVVRNGGKE